jgi:hypothetical protein
MAIQNNQHLMLIKIQGRKYPHIREDVSHDAISRKETFENSYESTFRSKMMMMMMMMMIMRHECKWRTV